MRMARSKVEERRGPELENKLALKRFGGGKGK